MDEENNHDLKEAKVYKRSSYIEAFVECRNCSTVHRGTAKTESAAIRDAKKEFTGTRCGDKEDTHANGTGDAGFGEVAVATDTGISFEDISITTKEPLVVIDLIELRKYIKIQKCPICRGNVEGSICEECGFDISNF